MATVRPFRALRPQPEFAEEVASVPYDVIDSSEARALAEGRRHSFLHVIRPEIDLPEGTDEHADEVYERGAANLSAFAESEAFLTEPTPALYVYRLVMDGRPQTGIFGLVSVEEYDNDVILKHEKTRPDKEDDRTRHIRTQRAHAEPVMLTYRGDAEINKLVDEATNTEPLYDFTAPDGVQHTVWQMPDPRRVSHAFENVPNLYVADGHHRCAAASRVAKELPDAEGAKHFMAVLFPMEAMRILSYNRVVKRVPGGPIALLAELQERFEVREEHQPEPTRPGLISAYIGGKWYTLEVPEATEEGAAAHLDVARLQQHVLAPVLGVGDPRTDPNIAFVGGIRGTGALVEMVDSGRADVAFSMYPTSPSELLAVSDAGELMPPKSTWFEPKLRSGLLVNRF